MRFLVVEDHAGMASQLGQAFRDRGYQVTVVHDGREGLYEAREVDYTLALVDLGLPGLSGLELIRALRRDDRRLPIVVLTARDDVATIVEAMEAGADDYLKKPVYTAELFAHIEAVLRRSQGGARQQPGLLEFGPLQLDTRKRVVLRDGERVDLTRAEFDILEHLWRNAGRVQSRKAIADNYQREPGADVRANSVDGLVGRIKRKLDPQRTLNPIETVRGRGYLFRERP